ncbi:hypothetical protein BC941DRAFT_487432 [Chlamydoabsidia padenii]|nr:hypothetical protein BC941DRAFT_487432 [Chlamydoabsidia padenii]
MTDTVAPPLNSHCQPLDRACSSTTCDMCSHWKDQLDVQATTLTQLEDRLIERDLTLARLQQDIQQLNTKYVAVIDRASELQHQKDLVELDLEELSCKLFEEANGMVANEKRENWRLETKLQSVQQQLGDEQAQLAELRQRLLQWDQDEQQRYCDQQHQEQCLPVSPTPSALKQYAITSVTHNQIQWETFQHFVQLSHTVSLKKLHQFTYLRACQIEDVEPCLRFGFRSRLSPKKMMNYLLQRSCFIQHIPMENNNQRQQEASIPHSSITSSSNDGNDLVNTIDYQFKMDEKDNWLPIDQHCRDRLVAVCEFFVFIRNIHSRLYAHRTIDDLYYENIRLRLQMSFSR